MIKLTKRLLGLKYLTTISQQQQKLFFQLQKSTIYFKLQYSFSQSISNNENKIKKLDGKIKIFSKENKFYECLDLLKQKLNLLKQEQITNNAEIQKVNQNISQFYILTNNFIEGKKYFDISLKLCIDHSLRENKLDLYNIIAGSYLQAGQFEQAVTLYKEALQLSKLVKGELTNETGVCLLNLAKSMYKLNNHDIEIFQCYEQAKKIYELLIRSTSPDKKDRITAYKKNLGLVMEEIGSLKRLFGMNAKQEFEKALQIYSEVYDEKSQFLILPLLEIGNAFQLERNYHNALKLYLTALQISEQNQQQVSPLTLIQLLLGIARSYSELKMYKESIEALLRLEKMLDFVKDETGNNLSMKAMIKGHLGFLYIESHQLELAKQEIEKGLKISKDKFFKIYGILLCQSSFVLLNLDKKFKEALETAKQSYQIILQNDPNKKNPNLGDCLRIMGLSCIELGQKEQAKQYLSEALNILIEHSERKEDALKVKNELEKVMKQK